ncbi:HAMP domain-containing sensor histidine kinase [uncultured Xylophilus sp.]|uniref:sensor histidine kinase n=1 Tax=uncultured Xylophilus sp. TaxID=296832 RepID=UPI0025D4C1AA|nr:HAMP domain-containing sensor histidine kinase [uncultured Xylophilus sp.]
MVVSPPSSVGRKRPGPLSRLTQRLYVRIWLAVVLAVAVLTLMVGWAWQMASDPPLREVVVRTPEGQVVGGGVIRPRRERQEEEEARAEARGPAAGPPHPPRRPGPEFAVTMTDGRVLNIHLPRPPRNFWNRPPFGFFWTLGLVAVAVALATYPIIRKLTRRLENLQSGVEQWGRGDLSARVPEQGSDEVAFLARRFNHAAARIEHLVQSHKSLLANASHELRSPLTRIRMGLELMGTTPSSTFRDEISRNIAELDQLIDEILLASRLDAQEADMGTVETIDLVGLAAEECARTGAELELAPGGGDVQARGVAKLLRRAVRNLLENARRYGAGDITAIVRQEGGRAVVRVCDRGPGVPAELRERIFEPFYRLPGASEREGGVGLGLALVRSIAERHGGEARCEAREGGGAVFVLALPLVAD